MRLKDWAETIGSYEASPDAPKPIRLLLYGEPGSGKTRFSFTAPNPFFLDTDRGMTTIQTLDDIKPPRFLPLSKSDQVYKISKDLLISIRDSTGPFKTDPPGTLVIDSLNLLAEMILWEVMKRPESGKGAIDPVNEKSDYSHWAQLQNRLKVLTDIIRDLPCHVITTCGLRIEKDSTNDSLIGLPSIPGSTRDTIGHAFDEFFFMQPKGDGAKIKYMTYTNHFKYYAAKSRSGRPPILENATFSDLIKEI